MNKCGTERVRIAQHLSQQLLKVIIMTNKIIPEFIEVAANPLSLSMRKPVLGVGINDAVYKTSAIKDGKLARCPYYKAWKNMLTRCYSRKYQSSWPTYIGCTVAEEWHSFMNFRKWMKTQDWQGKALDKDILSPGNKIYSSETCVFVPVRINGLLTHIQSSKGKHPAGVSFHKLRNKYQAECWVNEGKKHLGYFATPEEASESYKKAKRKEILRHAMMQVNERIKQGLIMHAEAL